MALEPLPVATRNAQLYRRIWRWFSHNAYLLRFSSNGALCWSAAAVQCVPKACVCVRALPSFASFSLVGLILCFVVVLLIAPAIGTCLSMAICCHFPIVLVSISR